MSKHLVILKKFAVDKLQDNIRANMDRYESPIPNWGEFFGEDEYYRKTKVEIHGDNFHTCLGERFESENILHDDPTRCVNIFIALQNLTPKQATDNRIWVYLTHFVFWDYVRARWPLPKEKTKREKAIRTHYFMNGVRNMIRDNAISRLWWMAHVCNRLKRHELRDSLNALLLREDVRSQVMERATFCRSEPILDSLMKFMLRSFHGNQLLHERKPFRELCKVLNREGGVRVLDSLPRAKLDRLMEGIIQELEFKGRKLQPDFSGTPKA